MNFFRALILVSLGSTFCLPLAAETILFKNEADNFSIAAPAKMSAIQLTPARPNDALYRAKFGQDEYALRIVTYKKQVEVSARAQRGFFDVLRMHALMQLKGALVFERDVTLDDHLGREFTIRSTNLRGLEGIPVRFTQRIFAIKTRLYTLTTVARQHGLRHERFFDSFKLLKKVSAPENLRFEVRRVSHANNVAYTARLPGRHRLAAISEKSTPVKLSEDINELMYSRIYKVNDQELTFIVGTLAFPESAVRKDNAKALFKKAKDMALESLNLEAAETLRTKTKDGISRQLRVLGTKAIDGVPTKVLLGLFFFKDRYYQILILGDEDLINSDGQKFLDTFKAQPMP